MTHEKLTRCGVFAALLFAFVSSASATWKEQVLYSFQGIADGATPVGSVVFDSSGNMYGATQEGGSSSCKSIDQCGTVYELSQSGGVWTETVLYVFQGNTNNDGASPFGGLVMDSSGNLYGTTAYGGTGDCVLLGSKVGCGTVYELSPPVQPDGAWTETILYSFPSSKYGYAPWGDLVFDSAGNLYGATIFGGGKGTTCDPFYQYCGAVFELSPPKRKGGAWTEKVLHAFAGGTDGHQFGDGANPNGGLILDSKGAVYGTAGWGGNEKACPGKEGWGGCGMVFKLMPPPREGGPWKEEILRSFNGNDGAEPLGGVVFDGKGNLYGTTYWGPTDGYGLVFELEKPSGKAHAWKEAVLYAFEDKADGSNPSAGLTFGNTGKLYGTVLGGQIPYGVVFQLSPPKGKNSWSLSVLYNFKGTPDGDHPTERVVFDGLRNLYSTTQWGGTGTCDGGCGTVFEASP